jgi:hypothetical protein
MEIESEKETVSIKDNDFVILVDQSQIRHLLLEDLMLLYQFDHITVKCAEILIFQEIVIHKTPLTAAILEAPAIALSWEIDPFRMTEFIAHEIEIRFTAGGDREKADHFMERCGSVNGEIVTSFIHVGVHGGIRKAEDHGFIPDKRLVVAFHIGNGVFSRSAKTHFTPYFADAP